MADHLDITRLPEDVLVAGASGFVGRWLCERLASHCRVWALGHNDVNQLPSLPGVRWLPFEATDGAIPSEVPDNVGAVINLLQSPNYRDFPDNAEEMFRINLEATFRLLEWSRISGVQRFIYVSSGGIYGVGEEPFKETDGENYSGPLSFYLATNAASEKLVAAYKGYFQTVLLRPFFIYGPGQREEMLISRLIRRVLDGEKITIQGDEGISINPVYIEDMIESILRVFSIDGHHIINIAGAEVVSLRTIVNKIANELGREPHIECIETQTMANCVADISQMEALLLAPATDFGEGLRKLIRSDYVDELVK